MLRIATVATRWMLGAETGTGRSWFHTLGSSVEVNVVNYTDVVELVGAIFLSDSRWEGVGGMVLVTA